MHRGCDSPAAAHSRSSAAGTSAGVAATAAAPAAAPSGRGGNRPPTAATLAKPIDHGTWGGYLQHTKRGIPHCDICTLAKDERMEAMRAKSPTGKKATQTPAGPQDAAHGA